MVEKFLFSFKTIFALIDLVHSFIKTNFGKIVPTRAFVSPQEMSWLTVAIDKLCIQKDPIPAVFVHLLRR